MVWAPSATLRRWFSTRWRNAAIACSIDRTALLLLLHRGAFLLGVAPLADVLVRRHPAASGHRPVDDGDDAAVGGFDFRAGGFSLAHGGGNFLPVLHGLAREAAVGDAVFEQACQRAAGPRHVIRQFVQFLVAPVADDQPLIAVEHAQALRHVVERDAHAAVLCPQPVRRENDGECHRRDAGERGVKRAGRAPPAAKRRRAA